MAVEAGRDCLRGLDPGQVSSLVIASTSLPYADLQNSSIVAAALTLPEFVSTTDLAGSQRAATSALIAALQRRNGVSLVIAADKPRGKPASAQELQYGAGAAAFALGSENILALPLGYASVSAYFVDHFRASGQEHDAFWEERWVRDEGYAKIAPKAIFAALQNASLTTSDLAYFVMPSLGRGAAEAVAKQINFRGTIADDLSSECGYAGTAHSFLMLARVLEQAKAGERILLVGFGQGADALILEATGRPTLAKAQRGVSGVLADKYETDDYLRMLSFYGSINLEWGMRAEKAVKTALTETYRSARQLAGFYAGRCGACGTVQFPQLAYCVNPACNAPAERFDDVSLVDEPAKVLTFSADWLSYYPAPPFFVGFVQFENGSRLLMETVDAPVKAVFEGAPLRMVYRIKERDTIRGFNRYFWKATPVML